MSRVYTDRCLAGCSYSVGNWIRLHEYSIYVLIERCCGIATLLDHFYRAQEIGKMKSISYNRDSYNSNHYKNKVLCCF